MNCTFYVCDVFLSAVAARLFESLNFIYEC
jgi:hypothetical protein